MVGRKCIQVTSLFAFCIVSFAHECSAQSSKTITIHEIKCITTETITGPDKLYFLANDDRAKLKFNSLKAFNGSKPLNNGQTWKLNQKLKVDRDAVVVVQLFDRDTGVNDYSPFFSALAQSAADGAAASKAGKDPRAAAVAKGVKGIASALNEIKVLDPDDQLMFLTVPSDEFGKNLKYHEKGGVLIVGSNFEYELIYSVE